MPPCAQIPVLLVVFLSLDSVVHELNTVWYEKLHLWKKSLVC